SLWALGYPDQAIRSTDAAIALAEHLKHAPSLAHALLFASFCRQSCRDPVATFDMAERLIALATEHRLALYRTIGGIAHGWALVHLGHVEAGLSELIRNLEGYDPEKPKSFSASNRAALAEVYLKSGRTEHTLDAIDGALKAQEEAGSSAWLAGIVRL